MTQITLALNGKPFEADVVNQAVGNALALLNGSYPTLLPFRFQLPD
jgi:hypothetical protein